MGEGPWSDDVVSGARGANDGRDAAFGYPIAGGTNRYEPFGLMSKSSKDGDGSAACSERDVRSEDAAAATMPIISDPLVRVTVPTLWAWKRRCGLLLSIGNAGGRRRGTGRGRSLLPHPPHPL